MTSVQIRPEFPSVSHHICIGYTPHKPTVKYNVAYWTDVPRDEDGSALPEKGRTFLGEGIDRASGGNPGLARELPSEAPGGFECYLPGNYAADLVV